MEPNQNPTPYVPAQQPTPVQPTAAPPQSTSTLPAEPVATPAQPQVFQPQIVQPTLTQPAPATSAVPQPSNAPVIEHGSPKDAPAAQSLGAGGPAYGAPTPPVTPAQPPQGKGGMSKRKKLIIAGVSAVAIAGVITAVGVFAFYLPNRPDAVYNTGLDRTGWALEKIANDASEGKTLQNFKSSDVTGSYEVAGMKGTFSSSYSSKASDSKIEHDADGKKVSIELKTNVPENSQYPDVYVKASGLTALGLDQYVPQIKDLENKWIEASSKYLESLAGAEANNDATSEITEDDITEVATIIGNNIKQYVFTGDKNQSILQQKEFLGTEKTDGFTLNKYSVAINKDNGKKFCDALSDDLKNSKLYSKSKNNQMITEELDGFVKDCKDGFDDPAINNESIEMWLDKSRKLIHKVRFSDNERREYSEFGQKYTSGDVIPLFATYKGEDYNINLTTDINLKDGTATGGVTASGGGEDSEISGKLSFEIKPRNSEVTIEKPDGAIPLEDVLKSLDLENIDSQPTTTEL